jgi:hypothetical protein
VGALVCSVLAALDRPYSKQRPNNRTQNANEAVISAIAMIYRSKLLVRSIGAKVLGKPGRIRAPAPPEPAATGDVQ